MLMSVHKLWARQLSSQSVSIEYIPWGPWSWAENLLMARPVNENYKTEAFQIFSQICFNFTTYLTLSIN